MRKLHKVVHAHELQNATANGWQWDGIPLTDAEVFEHKDTTGREPTQEERNRGVYNRIYEPSQPFFGNRAIFVVWCDHDELAERERMTSELADARGRAYESERVLKENAKKLIELEEKLKAEQEKVTYARAQTERVETLKRKLEGDLAKVRTAIGDMKMTEIIGEKKS
jgi:hypothetical protein